MLILPFDTETTGLPDWKTPSEGPDQPHMVELACLLIDPLTLSVRDAFDCLIRPDGWTWDAESEAFKAHGITVEQAMDEGIAEADALEQFLAIHAQADLRVAHNKTFDERIIRIAIKRYGMNGAAFAASLAQEVKDAAADAFKAAASYCTMVESRPLLKLPFPDGKKRGFKNPRLEEAHQHFFARPLEGAHRAMTDTDACARVYFALNQPESTLPVRLWPPYPVNDLAKMDEFAAAGAATGDGTHDGAQRIAQGSTLVTNAEPEA